MSVGLKSAGVVVSASMALVATQALAYVAQNSEGVVEVEKVSVDPELEARIEAAVAKQNVKQAVSASFSVLASRLGTGNTSLSAKYFPNAEGMVAQASSDDFVGGAGCYSNCHAACHSACHSACHGACHGSRGWR
jgi:hypothetical protein